MSAPVGVCHGTAQCLLINSNGSIAGFVVLAIVLKIIN